MEAKLERKTMKVLDVKRVEDGHRTCLPVADLSIVDWKSNLDKKLREDLATIQTDKDHFSQGIDFDELDYFEENGLFLFGENIEF